jgi:general secretion pathway protein E
VLSTIHTNDAASAFTRLIQMEIEAFRVRSTIVGILAQRLVRVLCPHCKEPYTGTPYELAQLGIDPARTRRRDERKLSPAYIARSNDRVADYTPVGWRSDKMPTLYRPRGCGVCDNKGFTGRLGIYELLMADDAVGEAVMQSSDAQSIRRVAQGRGMDTLRDDGARKALLGITTVEEVVAATQDDMFDE